MNLLRLAGFGSIREGLQAVMHDITALLALARRQPETDPEPDLESALPQQGRYPASEVNDGACPEKPVHLSRTGNCSGDAFSQ